MYWQFVEGKDKKGVEDGCRGGQRIRCKEIGQWRKRQEEGHKGYMQGDWTMVVVGGGEVAGVNTTLKLRLRRWRLKTAGSDGQWGGEGKMRGWWIMQGDREADGTTRVRGRRCKTINAITCYHMQLHGMSHSSLQSCATLQHLSCNCMQ